MGGDSVISRTIEFAALRVIYGVHVFLHCSRNMGPAGFGLEKQQVKQF